VGYTFPMGATLRLAALLPIPALTMFGELLVAVGALIWLVVATRTVRGAWRGELFFTPCLVTDLTRVGHVGLPYFHPLPRGSVPASPRGV
jgi:hypothetical protein